MMVLLPFLAAAVAAQSGGSPQTSNLGRTAWVFTTLAHSEWCPPGTVRVDIRTGSYELTVRAPRRICSQRALDRPVRKGRLNNNALVAVRRAYWSAASDDLTSPDCMNGGPPTTVVVSNGGRPILLVVSGRRAESAPDQVGCWSNAATVLHDLLNRTFPEAAQR